MAHLKLVIDITQLIHWQGKLTGIPRVMNEITLRYKDENNTKFVVWEPASSKYVEVEIAKSLSDRGKKLHYAGSKNTNGWFSFFIFRALRKIKKLKAPIPERLISFFGKHSNNLPEFEFSNSDKLFVLWGEINDSNFINNLKRLNERGVGIIQVSYDMLPLVTPQYSGHSTKSMTVYNTAVFPIADLILSISDHTKKDIIEWLQAHDLHVPSVEFFRLGDDFQASSPKKPQDAAFKSSKLKGSDFLLTVGTIEARKNHTLLYYVYKLAEQKGIELSKIVIVGRKGWLSDGIYEFMTKDPLVKDKFVVLESASDEELAWLYKKALFSVYPSFYEGWGLPIAESIAHGTPCICSDTSSMPEVAGDLVDYFNPLSAEELLQKMQEYLNPVKLKKQRQKITKYKPTSWDTTFKQVKQIIEETYEKTN